MSKVSNHHNFDVDGSSYPYNYGDRYFSQDLGRDFFFLLSKMGDTVEKLIATNPCIIKGGVVTQGAGATLNITACEAFAKFSVKVPSSFASVPPTMQSQDIEMILIESTQQTNLAIPSYTPGGAKNYVKLAFAHASGSTRARARRAGSYTYDQSPSYLITCDTTSPVSGYEVVLATFMETGGTFTFATTERTANINNEGAKVAIYTALGSNTWTHPNPGVPYTVVAHLLGGGGGAGGGGAGGGTPSGTGGSAGGGIGTPGVRAALTIASSTTVTADITVTIGDGGVGGAVSADGSAGSNTTLSGGMTATATGGVAGVAGNAGDTASGSSTRGTRGGGGAGGSGYSEIMGASGSNGVGPRAGSGGEGGSVSSGEAGTDGSAAIEKGEGGSTGGAGGGGDGHNTQGYVGGNAGAGGKGGPGIAYLFYWKS